jgi:putative nucleotidyltransferase with HDIG domain
MERSPSDYIPIPIGEFTAGVRIPVDLFIRLGEEKFVLVSKAETTSDVQQYRNYQNREVAYVWVIKKEYYKVAHQEVTLAGITLTKKDLNDGQKTALVTVATRSLFRQIEHSGMDLDMVNNAKQVTEAVVGLVEHHKSLNDLLATLASFSDQLLVHSVATSVLSVMLASRMGYQKKTTLEKVGLGGLLHDIGLKAIPPELSIKPISAMTHDELKLYETHCFKGQQMLTSLGVVPDDVVSIVYEHHENSIGQGFPQRLRDVKIHPLAKVVGLADAFADLIFPNANCPRPKSPREAIVFMEHTLGVPYNREAFRALKRLVNGDPSLKIAA